MTRRADPDRIDTARREAAIARLVSAGELPGRASAWVARFEATIDGRRDRADWETFDEWLERERRPRAPPLGTRAHRGQRGRQEV